MSNSNIPTTPESEVQRLREAAALLQDNRLWHEALDKMEGEYVEQLLNTEHVQTTHRENAYFMVQAIRRLKQQIQSFTQAGRLDRTTAAKNVKRDK